MLSTATAFSTSCFRTHHCLRSFRGLLVNLDETFFRLSSCSEPDGINLRESTSAKDMAEIHWFSVILWFKLQIDVTAVSTAVRLFFQATSGSSSFSKLPRCYFICLWNLPSAFSSLSLTLMGIFNVGFLCLVRRKQIRALIRALSESKHVFQNEWQSIEPKTFRDRLKMYFILMNPNT